MKHVCMNGCACDLAAVELATALELLDKQAVANSDPKQSPPPPSTSGSVDGSGSPVIDPDTLWKILILNCFSEESMDEAMAVAAVAAAAGPWTITGDPHGFAAMSAAELLAAAAASQEPMLRPSMSTSTTPSTAPTSRQGASSSGKANSSSGKGRSKGGSGGSSKGGGGSSKARQVDWSRLPSHTGLWVEHAWMNHSCAPNVVNYVLGRCMVIRAGGWLNKGTELCDNYLGASIAAPLQVR